MYRTIAGIPPVLRAKFRAASEGRLRWPLTVLGGVGTGKTCAALCLLDHTRSNRYATLAGLGDDLIRADRGELWHSGPNGAKISAGEIWRAWERVELVVLDEIGTRSKATDFQYETLKRAIDAREGRPAVFVSNLGLNAIRSLYDDRIASRLAAGEVVELQSADRRLE